MQAITTLNVKYIYSNYKPLFLLSALDPTVHGFLSSIYTQVLFLISWNAKQDPVAARSLS